MTSAIPRALYRFHVGHTTRHGDDTIAADREAALEYVGRAYPAFTLTETHGRYTHADGVTVEESGWTLEVYAPLTPEYESTARGVAELIGETLEQECVGLAIIPVGAFLLIGDGGQELQQ